MTSSYSILATRHSPERRRARKWLPSLISSSTLVKTLHLGGFLSRIELLIGIPTKTSIMCTLLVDRVVSQHQRRRDPCHVPRARRRRVLLRQKRPRPTRASITFHPATLSRIGTLQKNPSCSLVASLTRTHWASGSSRSRHAYIRHGW
jgi:hypothetical protein